MTNENLISALRDIIGVVPQKDRHWIENDVALIEKAFSELNAMRNALLQIENIAGRHRA